MEKTLRSFLLVPALLLAMAPALHGLHMAYGSHEHCHHPGYTICKAPRIPTGYNAKRSQPNKECPLCVIYSAIHQNAAKHQHSGVVCEQTGMTGLTEVFCENPRAADMWSPCPRGPPVNRSFPLSCRVIQL